MRLGASANARASRLSETSASVYLAILSRGATSICFLPSEFSPVLELLASRPPLCKMAHALRSGSRLSDTSRVPLKAASPEGFGNRPEPAPLHSEPCAHGPEVQRSRSFSLDSILGIHSCSSSKHHSQLFCITYTMVTRQRHLGDLRRPPFWAGMILFQHHLIGLKEKMTVHDYVVALWMIAHSMSLVKPFLRQQLDMTITKPTQQRGRQAVFPSIGHL